MTLVVDTGALVDFLLLRPAHRAVAEIIAGHEGDLHAPELQVPETVSVLRQLVAGGAVGHDRAADALDDALAMPIELHPHRPLAAHTWMLRDNFTAYDATYVALARALGADLLTLDARLARAIADHTTVTVLIPETT